MIITFNWEIMVFLCYACNINHYQNQGYTFRGSNSVIYISASLVKRGLLSKERICFSWSKFFLLRVNPCLEGLWQLGKQTGSHKVVSHCKNGEKKTKHGGVPTDLKTPKIKKNENSIDLDNATPNEPLYLDLVFLSSSLR